MYAMENLQGWTIEAFWKAVEMLDLFERITFKDICCICIGKLNTYEIIMNKK